MTIPPTNDHRPLIHTDFGSQACGYPLGIDEVVAGIPYLLGFVPEDSVVVVALSGIDTRPVTATMRVDLPSEEDTADRDALVAWIDQPMAQAVPATASFVVVVWTEAPSIEDRAFAIELQRALVERTQVTTSSVLVWSGRSPQASRRWRAACCDDDRCCPVDGRVLGQAALHRARKVFGAEDRPPAPSRRTLESELTAEAEPSAWPDVDDADLHQEIASEAIEVAVAHAGAFLRGHVDPRGMDLALFASALSDTRVRDTVLRDLLAGRRRRWPKAADILAVAVRQVPESLRAPVATVLGIVRWQMGDGVRAIIAIECALDCDPDYNLALLAHGLLCSGVHPEQWRRGIERIPRSACVTGRLPG